MVYLSPVCLDAPSVNDFSAKIKASKNTPQGEKPHCAVRFARFVVVSDYFIFVSNRSPGRFGCAEFSLCVAAMGERCALGRCAFGRPCPNAPSPFHAMRRVVRGVAVVQVLHG
ncbi:MAG: hypothetical protein FWC70_11890, partial [Defluviitaleaceae bacterium]|nr:hypothetical protein [Defluviitaleaceae bacterium]